MLKKDGQEVQLQTMQAKVDLDLIRDREAELKQLEQDIQDIACIFRDLNEMVVEQGEDISKAEENIDAAVVHIEDAKQELVVAVHYQKKSRRKMFIVAAVVVVLIIIISTLTALFWSNKVCYKNVGCFENSNPFDNTLGQLPDSPDNIKVKVYLWTRENPEIASQLFYDNTQSIADSNFDASRPTKILIHGFMSSKDEPVIANLSVALIKQGDYNIIGIDWSAGSRQFYPKAVSNTRVVGAIVSRLVQTLQTDFSLKLSDLHIIGHSLGAHTAGYIGLDPAGPLFAKTDAVVRLDPTDALYVDVIHSDGAPFEDAGFGTMSALGHKDFYPNGGQVQKGCPPPIKTTVGQILTGNIKDAFNSVSCAHDRAIWYYIESVLTNACHFNALRCSSWEDFKGGNCDSSGPRTYAEMGFNSENTNATGTFYLETNAQSPYCITS
ncbi:hypothetical protein DPMN_160641 [Dreissena polymorpha]|uniref:t-SNARE coiled-coil homology domain-containing protein n=1 Tax=Dreissena polymorpha TaxID=45954 RepID=A0A9D4IRW3_DREPO|nr:hypothetical protein DPMN_160641 [Dreissena polymorpha]